MRLQVQSKSWPGLNQALPLSPTRGQALGLESFSHEPRALPLTRSWRKEVEDE